MESLVLEAESFGDPDEVSTPNLASLTLLVEDDETSLLLTGDALGDQIGDGLRTAGRLTTGTFEVDVLKVPHHGSENNLDSDFVETVIARDYVFCGYGSSDNPNTDVIDMMFRRRLAASQKPLPFLVQQQQGGVGQARSHGGSRVKKLAKKGKGRFKFQFLTKGSTIRIV